MRVCVRASARLRETPRADLSQPLRLLRSSSSSRLVNKLCFFPLPPPPPQPVVPPETELLRSLQKQKKKKRKSGDRGCSRRSAKVRGWHFNCAYVIYGARRASRAQLVFAPAQFIGLAKRPAVGRGGRDVLEEWRISIRINKLDLCGEDEANAAPRRAAPRRGFPVRGRLSDSVMRFHSVELNSGLTS